MDDRILVQGAGIAGLTMAIRLRQLGHAPVVVEQRDGWAPAASGIFVNSNGLAMLERLGVLDAMLAEGQTTKDDAMEVHGPEGERLATVVYPRVGGGHIPSMIGIRRTRLQDILAARAMELETDIRFGTSMAGFQQSPERPDAVAVTLTDGSHDEYDLVVGADGIMSDVRRTLFPARAPRHSGFGVWRVVCPRPPGLDHKLMFVGAGPRIGVMPISEDEVYAFGTTRESPEARYHPAAFAEIMTARFSGYRHILPDLLASGLAWHFTQVEEVEPVTPWSSGSVVIIGDAAHATTPFMAQGAAMAMEDGVVLAEMVACRGQPMIALLAEFERRRTPRVSFVQERSLAVARDWDDAESRTHGGAPASVEAEMQAAVDELYEVLATPP